MNVEQKLKNIQCVLDALNCGAALADRDGNILHVNTRMSEMVMRPRELLIGHNVREFYAAADARKAIDESLKHVDEARDDEFYLPRPDGTWLPVATSTRPLSAPLNDLHILTAIDVSRQKNAEHSARENLRLITDLSDTLLQQALSLKNQAQALEDAVRTRTEELREANLDAIVMLAIACEAKDADTGRHVQRIQTLADRLAQKIGIEVSESHEIGYSAILHDVGKMHVPDQILKKPGPLDEDELIVMRQHTIMGERILSARGFFDRARKIARSHHENWDGTGYPDGLGKHQIPVDARIVRIVDVYDALTSQRVYKSAWEPPRAVQFISKMSGAMFEPELVKSFVALAESGDLEIPGLGSYCET